VFVFVSLWYAALDDRAFCCSLALLLYRAGNSMIGVNNDLVYCCNERRRRLTIAVPFVFTSLFAVRAGGR
jgi:hypothetical protein